MTKVNLGPSDIEVLIIKQVHLIMNGSIALAYDITNKQFILVWERGGDWNIFDDRERYNESYYDGFTPQDIFVAACNAKEMYLYEGKQISTDMDWFIDFADSLVEV